VSAVKNRPKVALITPRHVLNGTFCKMVVKNTIITHTRVECVIITVNTKFNNIPHKDPFETPPLLSARKEQPLERILIDGFRVLSTLDKRPRAFEKLTKNATRRPLQCHSAKLAPSVLSQSPQYRFRYEKNHTQRLDKNARAKKNVILSKSIFSVGRRQREQFSTG
jgi:hypothetical protein